MASLQDQLLKAGLADEKKAKQINKDKRKQAKQVPKGQSVANETREAAQAALAEKTARDKALAGERNAKAEKKAIAAQIKQLIQTNAINRDGGDVAYQFSDGKKIKKLYVTALLQEQLSKGIVAIVKLGDAYEVVPAKVAAKIAQRNESYVVLQNTASADVVDEDDPYADYEIPDDLMW